MLTNIYLVSDFSDIEASFIQRCEYATMWLIYQVTNRFIVKIINLKYTALSQTALNSRACC